jgi:hypothetical protein
MVFHHPPYRRIEPRITHPSTNSPTVRRDDGSKPSSVAFEAAARADR